MVVHIKLDSAPVYWTWLLYHYDEDEEFPIKELLELVQPHDDVVIVYWSKHAEDEKPNPVDAEICWFEGSSREWIAFDKKTGEPKPDIILTFGDEEEQEELNRMRSRKMYEDLMRSTPTDTCGCSASLESIIAVANEAPPEDESGQDTHSQEAAAQGYSPDAPPFKWYTDSGNLPLDTDPDLVWQLVDCLYRGFRFSTLQYDPSAKPQLAGDDKDAVSKAKDWLAQLKGRETGDPNTEWDDQSVYHGQASEYQAPQGDDLQQHRATEPTASLQQHGEPSESAAAQQSSVESSNAAGEANTTPSSLPEQHRNENGPTSNVSQQPNPATGIANPVPSRQPGQRQSSASSCKRKVSADDAVKTSLASKKPKTATSEGPGGGGSQSRSKKAQDQKTKDGNGQASVTTHQRDRSATLATSVIATPLTRSEFPEPNNKRKVDKDDDDEPSSPRKKTKTAYTSTASNAQSRTSQPFQDFSLHIGPAERAKLRKRGQADPPSDTTERKRVRFTDEEGTNRNISSRAATPSDAGVHALAAPVSSTNVSTSASDSVLPRSTEGRRRQAPRELIRQAKNNSKRAHADTESATTSTGSVGATNSSSNQATSFHAGQPPEESSTSRPANPDREQRTSTPQAPVHSHPSDGSNNTQRIQATPQQPQQRPILDFMAQQTASVAQAFTRPTSDDTSMMPPPVSRHRATPSVGSVKDPLMGVSSEASLGPTRAPTPNTSGQPTRPAVSTAQPTLSDAMVMPPPPVPSRATPSRPTVSSSQPTSRQSSMPSPVVQPGATPSVSSVGHPAVGATSGTSHGRAGNTSMASVSHSSGPTVSSVQHPSRAPTSSISDPHTRTQDPSSTHQVYSHGSTTGYTTGGEQFFPYSHGAMHGYYPSNGMAHPAPYLPSQPQHPNLSWEYWPEPPLADNGYLIDHGTLWEPLQPSPAHSQSYHPGSNFPSSSQPNTDFLWDLSQTPDPMELLFPDQLAPVGAVNTQPT
ncbi:MAG: hypothetical protein Q9181_007828, partial [Wetmoreana brouardii]